jgi:hypothetical protein
MSFGKHLRTAWRYIEPFLWGAGLIAFAGLLVFALFTPY